MSITCVLCKEAADPENPFKDGAIHAINPNTFREAWMHAWCFEIALEELHGVPAKDSQYDDRFDEYMTKFN